MKSRPFNINIIEFLKRNLISGYYTLESLSREYNIPRPDLQRAFQYLRIQPGWSIRIKNSIPYWRNSAYGNGKGNPNRWRKKGDPYRHDHNESDWEPTIYDVERPGA